MLTRIAKYISGKYDSIHIKMCSYGIWEITFILESKFTIIKLSEFDSDTLIEDYIIAAIKSIQS